MFRSRSAADPDFLPIALLLTTRHLRLVVQIFSINRNFTDYWAHLPDVSQRQSDAEVLQQDAANCAMPIFRFHRSGSAQRPALKKYSVLSAHNAHPLRRHRRFSPIATLLVTRNPGDSLTPITLQTRAHCPEGHRFLASIASCLVSPRLPTHGRLESPI
jgi:hypothetical protein